MIDWKSLDIWMHKKLLTKMAASISYFLAFKKEDQKKNRRNSNKDIDVLFSLKLHYDSYDIRLIRNKIASCSKDIRCKLGKYISEKKSCAKFCHY